MRRQHRFQVQELIDASDGAAHPEEPHRAPAHPLIGRKGAQATPAGAAHELEPRQIHQHRAALRQRPGRKGVLEMMRGHGVQDALERDQLDVAAAAGMADPQAQRLPVFAGVLGREIHHRRAWQGLGRRCRCGRSLFPRDPPDAGSAVRTSAAASRLANSGHDGREPEHAVHFAHLRAHASQHDRTRPAARDALRRQAGPSRGCSRTPLPAIPRSRRAAPATAAASSRSSASQEPESTQPSTCRTT